MSTEIKREKLSDKHDADEKKPAKVGEDGMTDEEREMVAKAREHSNALAAQVGSQGTVPIKPDAAFAHLPDDQKARIFCPKGFIFTMEPPDVGKRVLFEAGMNPVDKKYVSPELHWWLRGHGVRVVA